MYDNNDPTQELSVAASSNHDDTEGCPVCGGPIQFVERRGPNDVSVSPCGHDITDAQATALATTEQRQYATDGGRVEKYDNQPGNFMEGLKQNAERFEDNNDDLEAIIEGDIGFHAYFTSGGPDPTQGCQTAIFQGVYDELEEFYLDAETVELNQGEVTPRAVRQEAIEQLHHFTHLPDNLVESIGDRIEERVAKNLDQQGDEEVNA